MDTTQTQAALPPVQRKAKHTILFLAANPLGTTELALGREARAIQEEIERSGHREQFQLVTRWAVQPLDLLRELRRLKPTIVHFSGHGGTDELTSGPGARRDVVGELGTIDGGHQHGLFFEGADGRPQLVSTAALDGAFGASGSSVKLVVLNACHSDVQAEALLAHVHCVVGMRDSISDDAARSFAIGFYGGLGECESVAAAFRQGVAAIRLRHHTTSSGTAQRDTLARLLTLPGVDPNDIYIIHKLSQRTRCTIVIKANLKEFDAEVIMRVRDQLRLLSGDVSLEIIEVQEGSVRLTLSLSAEAAIQLEALSESGQLNQICEFDVSSVRVHEAADVEFEDRTDEPSPTSMHARSEVAVARLVTTETPSDGRERQRVDAHLVRDIREGKLIGANLVAGHLERANLVEANLIGAKLERANLVEADLRRANLERVDLRGANLIGANLERANLVEANLVGADLRGANLIGANLERANLVGADLWEAKLMRANLVGANLERANLVGANLFGAKLDGANLIEAKLGGADLRRAKLMRANLGGADLRGAKLNVASLIGAHLERANLGGASLRRANLIGAKLERANLVGADLCEANLERADLRGANLIGADLERARLGRADLRDAKLDGAKFDGAKLEKSTVWPAGFDPSTIAPWRSTDVD